MKLTSSFFISLLVLSGCETPQRLERPKATATLSCKVPTITPLPETKEAQEKGGIEISVAPASYKPLLEKRIRHMRVEPNIGESLQISLWLASIPPDQRGNYVFVEETTETSVKPTPDHLQFLIKINNKLSRVFRGAGTVVQFNVGGKLLAVDQAGYAQMLQAIVPPRTEHQLSISGPAVDVLPDNATIGLFLYDVVTAIDAAGNVTEKQNYEWYFTCVTKLAEETVEVAPSTRKLIPIQSLRQ
ncbi:MAG: hypothetical protein HYY24_02165 [Verrucomicrobia bacterium]|nr:hypothetical protein [Verrucomicrobiota bacterium]